MLVLGSAYRCLPLLDVLSDTLEILRAVEASFLQVVEQALHGGNGRIDGRRFMVATDCEEEKTDELETIVQSRVETVLLVWLVDAQSIEGFDLLDKAVVEDEDILRLDVCAAVLLEQAERVAQIEDALKDGLFLRIEREAVERRVGHAWGG